MWPDIPQFLENALSICKGCVHPTIVRWQAVSVRPGGSSWPTGFLTFFRFICYWTEYWGLELSLYVGHFFLQFYLHLSCVAWSSAILFITIVSSCCIDNCHSLHNILCLRWWILICISLYFLLKQQSMYLFGCNFYGKIPNFCMFSFSSCLLLWIGSESLMNSIQLHHF